MTFGEGGWYHFWVRGGYIELTSISCYLFPLEDMVFLRGAYLVLACGLRVPALRVGFGHVLGLWAKSFNLKNV